MVSSERAALTSRYQEVVVDRLFDGKTQLTRAVQPLMLAAEKTLHLDASKRSRSIVRVDAGGGSLQDVNWLLSRGYQVHGKDYSGPQAKRLVAHAEGAADRRKRKQAERAQGENGGDRIGDIFIVGVNGSLGRDDGGDAAD